MRLEILGSGGSITVPRAGYHDHINDEARDKGVPFQRRGPSVFLHGPNILFDTPEDVGESLNRADVDEVSACFYSHWHPDHVMGRRIFEQLNWDLLGNDNRVTDVYVPERVRTDMQDMLGTWSHFEYLQELGVVRLHVLSPGETVTIDEYTITPVALAEEYVYSYLVEHDELRTWIAMDELVGWSPDEMVADLDLAVMASGVCEFHPLTGDRLIQADDPILQMEMRFERAVECIREMAPKQAVIMHLEEMHKISYGDGLVLSQQLQNDGLPVTLAWDGLIVDLDG